MKKTSVVLHLKTTQKSQGGITIGIDLGDIWSHYCTLNQDGEVVDRGRFRTKQTLPLQIKTMCEYAVRRG